MSQAEDDQHSKAALAPVGEDCGGPELEATFSSNSESSSSSLGHPILSTTTLGSKGLEEAGSFH